MRHKKEKSVGARQSANRSLVSSLQPTKKECIATTQQRVPMMFCMPCSCPVNCIQLNCNTSKFASSIRWQGAHHASPSDLFAALFEINSQ